MAASQTFSELPHCAICGARDVRIDYFDGDVPLELGECPRCCHRWTRSLAKSQRQPSGNVAVALLEDVRGLPHAA